MKKHKNEHHKKLPINLPFYRLYSYSKPVDMACLLLGSLCAICAGAGFPFLSLLFGQMIDTFSDYSTGKSNQELFQTSINKYTLYFVWLAAFIFVSTYVFTSAYNFVGQRQSIAIREKYMMSVLKQDMEWFDSLSAGEITTRIVSDTSLVQSGIGEKVAFIVQDAATFTTGFVIAFTADWLLTLIISCIIPLIGISVFGFVKLVSKYMSKSLEECSKAGTLTEEAICSIKTVVAFNQKNKLIELYNEHLVKAEKYGYRKVMSLSVGLAFAFFVTYCGYSLAFYAGGSFILSGKITPGIVVNVLFSILIGAFSLDNIAPNIQAISVAKGAAAKLFETINRNPKIDSSSKQGIKPDECRGDIEFKNVSFSYPSRKEVSVLTNFCIRIKKERSTAVIGASGSGKSTIIQLIERFYNPDSGNITLDDIPIKDLNLKWFRTQIGLVDQQPTLFSGTIAENVAHGLIGTEKENWSLENKMQDIIEACIKSNAHDFISSFPSKYETEVGEIGNLLSGGQKQRIAIARAIIKNPRILLLDEATSALDTNSELIVQDALEKAKIGRTTVLIAHRLSTIKECDNIVLMDKGQIIEAGNHNVLMKKQGEYYKLIRMQDMTRSKNLRVDEKKSSFKEPHINSHNSSFKEKNVRSNKETVHTVSEYLKIDTEERNFEIGFYRLFCKILKISVNEKIYYFFGFIGATLQGCAHPMVGILFSNLLVVFVKKEENLKSAYIFWSLMFLLIAVLIGLGTFLQTFGFGISAEKLTTKLKYLYFYSLLSQEIAFFDSDSNTVGSLISRIPSDAQHIQGMSGVILGSVYQIIINLTGCIAIGLLYGWKLALVAIACLPIILSTGYVRIAMSKKVEEKIYKTYSKTAKLSCESVNSIRTVASLTKENQIMEEYRTQLRKAVVLGYKNSFAYSLIYSLSRCSIFLVNALIFWFGSTLFKNGEYDLSKMFTVYMCLVLGINNVSRILAYAPDLGKAKKVIHSLFKVIDRTPLFKNKIQVMSLKKYSLPIVGKINFEDVHFSYPTRKQVKVLRGITFEAKMGDFIALVGSSGCGKSTTLSLIERFYDIYEGKILIDGVNIEDYDLKILRNSISLVSQEPSLYNMTIKENILFGHNSYEPAYFANELLIKVCKEANIHDFIISLPEGYETKIGSKGSQLSGGQKQRIAIARALIRNPKILLLDEATSALDAKSEKIVQDALDKASKGRTTIAIAHRLATIQNADMILVFSEGRIIERGNHHELLSFKGAYYEMVKNQALDNENC